jgi:N utilization substance protein B
MAARTKARKRAVDIVFESDLRAVPVIHTLRQWCERADPPVAEHTVRLVELIAAGGPVLDAMVAQQLSGWTWDRVAPVDRSVLRVGAVELLIVDDVPDAVAIDEAVELARSLSGDEAPGFVNGVLARLAADKPSLRQRLLDAQVDRASGVGVEHAPADQPLGELSGALVVDDGE